MPPPSDRASVEGDAAPSERNDNRFSTPSQLLAEVDRLAAELAAARAEIDRLAALADEDALCGVLNRRGFEREFRRSLAHATRYGTAAALLIIDLDDFKQINDTQGHSAGDALLRGVARALAANLRGSDVLARIGGDEFAVILWHAGLAEAGRAASRLLAALPARASVGIAELTGGDASAVFESADADLYAFKRTRKGGTAARR
jgi:diguanylate cyclase (GGDEF)-like protein